MQKLYSQLVGMPVFCETSGMPINVVRDLIIEPQTGTLLAFQVKGGHVIVPMDIEHIGTSILIPDRDCILEPSEVMRVSSTIEQGINIVGSKVYVEESGEYLGRVVDYAIDASHTALGAIYVARYFLFIPLDERTIPRSKIIKIEKGKIFIKGDTRIKAVEGQKARRPILEPTPTVNISQDNSNPV